MTISTDTLAKAMAEAARIRRERGDARYIAQLDDGRYIGMWKPVKTRRSALRCFDRPNPEDWLCQFPFYLYDYEFGDKRALKHIAVIKLRG